MATLTQDSKMIKILAAQQKGESVDSKLISDVDKHIRALASDLNPQNLYEIGQIVRYTVNDLQDPATNFLSQIADVKRVGYGQKANFRIELDGIFAFIQAKGSTTRRSKISSRNFSLDTLEVSARPSLNIMELLYGNVSMSSLITKALYQMENVQLQYIQNVLVSAAEGWAEPYYAEGQGVVAATLDPMIQHWMRFGGATILGDISLISQLGELDGFTATTNSQWSDARIYEQSQNGFVGMYKGARVVQLINPMINGSDNLAIDPKNLYIMLNNADSNYRPLKVVYEGPIQQMEARHIDDKTYEVRLDQLFGAGIAFGTRPNLSVYHDASV